MLVQHLNALAQVRLASVPPAAPPPNQRRKYCTVQVSHYSTLLTAEMRVGRSVRYSDPPTVPGLAYSPNPLNKLQHITALSMSLEHQMKHQMKDQMMDLLSLACWAKSRGREISQVPTEGQLLSRTYSLE